MRTAVYSVIGVFCSTTAFAQVTGDTCVKLAETVAAAYSVRFTDRQFDAARYYANCDATQSSSSGGLNLAFSAFSLGAKLIDGSHEPRPQRRFSTFD
jgi:hypothetical protein